jgi:hypothetical protein
MIRIITSRRLAEMESERNRLREQASAAEEKADQALDRDVESQLLRARDRDQSQAQLSAADFARDVAESANAKLRSEVEELVEEVRQAETGLRCVYVLTRFGEIRGAHTSQEAAKAEAVRNGATSEGWCEAPWDVPLAESSWRITHRCVRPEEPGGTP